MFKKTKNLPHKNKNPVTFVTGFSGWLQGFEPWASRATIWRANQLRYSHHYEFLELFVLNEPEGIRTPDPRLRRPLLYPAELRTHKAGDGNRTHVSSLEGWCSTIELHPRFGNLEVLTSRYLYLKASLRIFHP